MICSDYSNSTSGDRCARSSRFCVEKELQSLYHTTFQISMIWLTCLTTARKCSLRLLYVLPRPDLLLVFVVRGVDLLPPTTGGRTREVTGWVTWRYIYKIIFWSRLFVTDSKFRVLKSIEGRQKSRGFNKHITSSSSTHLTLTLWYYLTSLQHGHG